MTGNYRPAPRQSAAAAPDPQGAPRIYGPFPAVVKGVDALGRRFKTRAVVESLSAGDFRLHLRCLVKAGERLFVAARIHRAAVLLRGTVSRVELAAEGECGLEVAISRSRFLPPASEGLCAAHPRGANTRTPEPLCDNPHDPEN